MCLAMKEAHILPLMYHIVKYKACLFVYKISSSKVYNSKFKLSKIINSTKLLIFRWSDYRVVVRRLVRCDDPDGYANSRTPMLDWRRVM